MNEISRHAGMLFVFDILSLMDGFLRILFSSRQLHLAALGSLRGEISELHARLQRAAQDRDTLEQALAKTQVLSSTAPFLFFFISFCRL